MYLIPSLNYNVRKESSLQQHHSLTVSVTANNDSNLMTKNML